jgi:hypothetical protein
MLTNLLVTISLAAVAAITSTTSAAHEVGALSTGRGLYAVMVDRDLPKLAPRFLVIGKFKSLIPDFRGRPGLRTKYFYTTSQHTRGGIYLWNDKAAADDYLQSGYFKALAAQSKGRLDIERYEIPVAINGPAAGSPAAAQGKAVVRIVRIAPPPGVTRTMILAGFDQAAPSYEKVPGLVHKWFSIGEDGRFGGIYLFESNAAADAWFNAAWHERVRKTYGADGDIRSLDAPVIVEN